MSDEISTEKIQRYASQRQLILTRRLGYGNQGSVWAMRKDPAEIDFAIKFHKEQDAFARELAVYDRLSEHAVRKVEFFNVPELLHADETNLVLEMTIVKKPFVLDFGGAYLDDPPQFSEEIWEQWVADKQEMFEERWPIVQRIISAFEDLGIHLMDVHTRNIAFSEQ